jgi:hypothetical protein
MSDKTYPLPNVPRGFRRLVTGDKIAESDLCDNRICKPCVNWEPIGKIGAAGMTYTKHHFPMIRAKPAPAKAKIPQHVMAHARELSAMGDAAKAKAKAKRAGKPVKAKRMKLGDMSKPSMGLVDSFVLPADAESVERMVGQGILAISETGHTGMRAEAENHTRAVLASIGIKA